MNGISMEWDQKVTYQCTLERQQRTGLSCAHLVSQLKLLPGHCPWTLSSGQCKRETLKRLSWSDRPPNSCLCCAYRQIPHNFHPHCARIGPEVHCCKHFKHWIGGFLQISSLRIRSKLLSNQLTTGVSCSCSSSRLALTERPSLLPSTC